MAKKKVPDCLPDPSDLMLQGEYTRGYRLSVQILKLIDDDVLSGRYMTLGALEAVKHHLLCRWMDDDRPDDEEEG